MNIKILSASVLAASLAALPVAAFAEVNGGGEVSGQVGIVNGGVQVSASTSAEVGDDNGGSGEVQASGEASSSERAGSAQATEHANESAFEHSQSWLFLEATATPVFSLEQLKQSIEARKGELDQEQAHASTTAQARVMEDANPVRLAVHTLLASKPLLGGIGAQVSVIAKQMNDSLATTTSAELNIESRGFITRLLFGGDKQSAEAISQAVVSNQERIQELTNLLNQAGTSADVKVALQAQIDALQTAQAHFQELADSEAKAWGLFSWRF